MANNPQVAEKRLDKAAILGMPIGGSMLLLVLARLGRAFATDNLSSLSPPLLGLLGSAALLFSVGSYFMRESVAPHGPEYTSSTGDDTDDRNSRLVRQVKDMDDVPFKTNIVLYRSDASFFDPNPNYIKALFGLTVSGVLFLTASALTLTTEIHEYPTNHMAVLILSALAGFYAIAMAATPAAVNTSRTYKPGKP